MPTHCFATWQGALTLTLSSCIEHNQKGNYGKTCRMIDGKKVMLYLHRLAYTEAYGPIPHGLEVRHKCDNPRCINPEHLEIGTHQDNANDMVKRKRQARHGKHGCAVLSSAQVAEVRELRKSGMTLKEIAARYGVHFSTISLICNNKRWSDEYVPYL